MERLMFRAGVQLKTIVQQNRIETKMTKQKCVETKTWFPCRLQTCAKSGQELAGLPVYGAKRLHNNGLEDVLVFQCAVFRDLAGSGQLPSLLLFYTAGSKDARG